MLVRDVKSSFQTNSRQQKLHSGFDAYLKIRDNSTPCKSSVLQR